MATRVDFSSVFDTVLPNVYIRNVSLAHANLADPRRGVEYDDDQNYVFEKNEFGKRFFPNLPPQDVQLIAEGKFLEVKAQIVIKDYYRDNQKSLWFENDEVLNLLKLRVLLSTKAQLTDDLRNRGLTEKNIEDSKAEGGLKEQIISLKKVHKTSLMDFQKQEIDGRTVYTLTYDVSFKVYRPNPRHVAMFAGTFMDLNEYARTRESLAQSRRRFLYGNFAGQLLVNKGERPLNSNVFIQPDGKAWAGPVHFQQETNSFMAGAFHSSQPHPRLERKVIGNTTTLDYRLLDGAEEATTLLQPYTPRSRRRRKAMSRQEDFKKIMKSAYISEPDYSTNRLGEVFMTFHINFDKIIKEKTQFGAIAVKADPDALNDIRGLTEIKTVKVYRNRVKKGFIPGTSNLVDFEDRTELIAEATGAQLDDGLSVPLEKTVNSYDEEARKITVGQIREIDLQYRGAVGIRTFGVSDLEMDRKTDGLYSYSVEFEMVDGTKVFAVQELDKLIQAKNLMIEYRDMAYKPDNIDEETGLFTDAFRTRVNELYDELAPREATGRNRRERRQAIRQSFVNLPWNNAVAAYIDVLGNATAFSNRDIAGLSTLLYSLVRPDTGSVEGINTVISLMEALEAKMSSALGRKAVLVNEVDYGDRTRAYKGKLPERNIFIEKRFQKIFNSNVQKDVGFDFLGDLGSRENAGHLEITVQDIRGRFADENAKYFISSGLGGNALLPEGLTKGLDLEPNFFSFLTPARARMGKGVSLSTLQKGNSILDKGQFDVISTTRLAMNPRATAPNKKLNTPADPSSNIGELTPPVNFSVGFNPTLSNLSEEDYTISTAMSPIMAAAGISITTPTLANAERLSFTTLDGQTEEKEDGVDPKEILGNNTNFSSDPLPKKDVDEEENLTPEPKQQFNELEKIFVGAMVDSEDSLFDGKKRATIEKISNPRRIFSKDLEVDDDSTAKQARFYNGLPNQIKSLFLTQTPLARVNWAETYRQTGEDILTSPSLANFLYYNYKHINRIEVLVGFEKDDRGELQISRPKYERLTRRLLQASRTFARPLLCRMTPYSNARLGIRKSKKLSMTEYDENFVIIPDTSPTTNVDEIAAETEAEIEDFITELLPQDPTTTEQGDELFRSVLVDRLTEYSELNSTGKRSLKVEVDRRIMMDEIPPEFQTNLVVYQPRNVTRIGTSFGDDGQPRRTVVESNARAALQRRATGTPARTQTLRTTGTTTTSGPTTTPSPGGTSGGGY